MDHERRAAANAKNGRGADGHQRTEVFNDLYQ
jgi:hypothetical protein